MIADQLDGLTGFFGLLLLPLRAAVEEVADTRHEPGDTGLDSGDGDLDVIQITVFVWSREVVRAEGAEQQGQKEIQHLLTDKRVLHYI